MLAPFGSKNPEPVFCARNIKISSPTVVGNNHLKMRLTSNGMACNSIWFNMANQLSALTGANLDVVFTPQINHWNGSSDIQLKMKDVTILTQPTSADQ
jgi:single-stranded-DNA-specific exonuclease